MDGNEGLERLHELLGRAPDGSPAPVTSVRIPQELRDAATILTRLGRAESLTELTVEGLRDRLVNVARRAALDAHYAEHPEAKPALAEVAQVGAELDGNPLAAQPRLIARAAREVSRVKPDASPDDVLVYAAGLAAGQRSAVRKRQPSDAA